MTLVRRCLHFTMYTIRKNLVLQLVEVVDLDPLVEEDFLQGRCIGVSRCERWSDDRRRSSARRLLIRHDGVSQ
jgi:hypothetical protein